MKAPLVEGGQGREAPSVVEDSGPAMLVVVGLLMFFLLYVVI